MAWIGGSLQRRLNDVEGLGGSLSDRVAAVEAAAGQFDEWIGAPVASIDNEDETVSMTVDVGGVSVAAGQKTEGEMRSHAAAINSIVACLKTKGLMANA